LFGSDTSSETTFPEARITLYMWIGKNGAGIIAVSPGPINARHMCEKPSLLPKQAMISVSGSSPTPYLRWYLLATSRRRFSSPFDLL